MHPRHLMSCDSDRGAKRPTEALCSLTNRASTVEPNIFRLSVTTSGIQLGSLSGVSVHQYRVKNVGFYPGDE